MWQAPCSAASFAPARRSKEDSTANGRGAVTTVTPTYFFAETSMIDRRERDIRRRVAPTPATSFVDTFDTQAAWDAKGKS